MFFEYFYFEKFFGIIFDRLEKIDSAEDNICFFLVR